MRSFLVLLLTTCLPFFAFTQNPNYGLIAEKEGKKTLVFDHGKHLKVKYMDGSGISTVRGKLMHVSNTGITLQVKKQQQTIEIPTITNITKISRTGRAITGVIALIGLAGGSASIADDVANDYEYFDGLGIGAGIGLAVVGCIPYWIILTIEPKATIAKGYTFKAIPESR